MQGRAVLLKDRPPIRYDVLSVNIGITPGANQVPGALMHTTPVKPITRWRSVCFFVANVKSLTVQNCDQAREESGRAAEKGTQWAAQSMSMRGDSIESIDDEWRLPLMHARRLSSLAVGQAELSS